MSEITIYHNPRCSKSRQTLELLKENGIEPKILEYLTTPLTASELDSVFTKLDKDPREVMRTKEAEYKESGADNPDLSRGELINKIIEFPKLLERPIVVNGDKAAIGRPPESVLDII
jgi:arsenate reductase